MDCKEAEELFVPYLLGALDSRERQALEEHLDTCQRCSLETYGGGEAVARLASAVPRLKVPARVKQRLFAVVDAELAQRRPVSPGPRSQAPGRGGTGRLAMAWARIAAALVLVVGLALAGFWFDQRVDRLTRDNRALQRELSNLMEREVQLTNMVMQQRYLSYITAAPGVSVNMLWGTEWSAKAWGMLACCAAADNATLAFLVVLNLPPLPADQVYQVWLFKEGQRYSAGTFTVDSTGYGQAAIIPVAPLFEFDAIAVTVEPSGGSPRPTGASVMLGDL